MDQSEVRRLLWPSFPKPATAVSALANLKTIRREAKSEAWTFMVSAAEERFGASGHPALSAARAGPLTGVYGLEQKEIASRFGIKSGTVRLLHEMLGDLLDIGSANGCHPRETFLQFRSLDLAERRVRNRRVLAAKEARRIEVS